MTEIIKKSDYKSLLDRVSTLIEDARRKAVKQIDTIIVKTYCRVVKRPDKTLWKRI